MSCTSTPFSYNVQYFYDQSCSTCSDTCGGHQLDATCVVYTGPNLACSGIQTNEDLETILSKIDEQICAATGDFSNFQFNGLIAWWGQPITTEIEYVDASTSYADQIAGDLLLFTGTTFITYQSSVAARFDALEEPEISCTIAGVTTADDLTTVLTKYCNTFGDLYDSISISAVDWDQCFTVTTPPTTLAEAFSLVIDQICQVSDAGATLPSFNNSANCLAGSSSDSLITTIGLITGVLCETDAFDGTALTLGCLAPATTDLQDVVQELVTQTNALIQNTVTYSGDFTVTPNGDPCDGVTLSLATPVNLDRFVAVDALDPTPGTLVDKLSAGSGITFTNLGNQLNISTAATPDSFKVKADSGGTDTEGFLENKVNGGSAAGVTITTNYNATSEQVDILPSINPSELFTYLLNQLDGDPDLFELFCSKLVNCPSPCDPPADVQAVAVNTTSTTTMLP